jgi:hypothetical protein
MQCKNNVIVCMAIAMLTVAIILASEVAGVIENQHTDAVARLDGLRRRGALGYRPVGLNDEDYVSFDFESIKRLSLPFAATAPSTVMTWGGSGSSVQAKSIVMDGFGNTYIAGEFQGTVNFDPAKPNASATITSHNGTVDAYLSKINSSGNLQWVRTWGGGPTSIPTCPMSPYSYSRDAANGVDVDASGNIYVAGLYQSTVDFGSGYVYTSNAPICSNNIYIVKFNPSGTTQWAKTWGGTSGGEGYSVAVDKVRGWVYVEGDWSTAAADHKVDFNPSGPTHDWHTNHGAFDAFLSKFDLSGNFLWADTWGGHGYDDGPGVAVDSSGNVYVAGMYGSTDINFDPSGATTTGGLGHEHGPTSSDMLYVNVFLSKFDSGGNFQWVRTWGGLETEDAGEMVMVDGADNVIVSGRFECTTCNFNAGPTGLPANFSSHGNRDAFISKYDSSGNYLWAQTWGGSEWDAAACAITDEANNVYATGIFSGTVDFGSGLVTAHGLRDASLSKFDSAGSWQWTKTWGGSGNDWATGIVGDGAGNLLVVGSFQNTVDFHIGSAGNSRTAFGTQDAFFSTFRFAVLDHFIHLPFTQRH